MREKVHLKHFSMSVHIIHLSLLHVAAHIEEVGRLAPVELNDVHGRHGQPGTVHQAANVTIHLHVIKVERCGLNFSRVRLCGILHVKNGFLSKLGIVVETQLGVGSVDQAI